MDNGELAGRTYRRKILRNGRSRRRSVPLWTDFCTWLVTISLYSVRRVGRFYLSKWNYVSLCGMIKVLSKNGGNFGNVNYGQLYLSNSGDDKLITAKTCIP